MKLDKECDFVGKSSALEAWQERGIEKAICDAEKCTEVEDADARGSEGLYQATASLVGRATSGGYGFRVNKSLALAMVQVDCAGVGTALEIEILGQRYAATVIPESAFDPDNKALTS